MTDIKGPKHGPKWGPKRGKTSNTPWSTVASKGYIVQPIHDKNHPIQELVARYCLYCLLPSLALVLPTFGTIPGRFPTNPSCYLEDLRRPPLWEPAREFGARVGSQSQKQRLSKRQNEGKIIYAPMMRKHHALLVKPNMAWCAAVSMRQRRRTKTRTFAHTQSSRCLAQSH